MPFTTQNLTNQLREGTKESKISSNEIRLTEFGSVSSLKASAAKAMRGGGDILLIFAKLC